MARNYVFLVHGVGKHPEGWEKQWTQPILAALRQYEPFKGLDDDDIETKHIAFVPISYDAIFEGYRNRWGEAAEGLSKALVDQEVTSNRSLLKALEWVATHDTGDAGDADNSAGKQFFWDNILDALLWFSSPQARKAVIARVNRQLGEGVLAMLKENDGVNRAHIISHSLGTSVSSDSLISLRYASEVTDDAFEPRQFQWKSIWMVANVSRLLQATTRLSDDVDESHYKVYTSAMKPGSPSRSICASYFNVHQIADPVTWPRQFAPADWPDNGYSDIQTRRYDELKEVHDFAHYIANPKVHIRIFRRVLGNNRFATGPEVQEAMSNFERDFPNQASDEFAHLRALLNGDFERKLGAKELVKFLVKTYKEIKP